MYTEEVAKFITMPGSMVVAGVVGGWLLGKFCFKGKHLSRFAFLFCVATSCIFAAALIFLFSLPSPRGAVAFVAIQFVGLTVSLPLMLFGGYAARKKDKESTESTTP